MTQTRLCFNDWYLCYDVLDSLWFVKELWFNITLNLLISVKLEWEVVMRVEFYNRETTCKHVSYETIEVFEVIMSLSFPRVE